MKKRSALLPILLASLGLTSCGQQQSPEETINSTPPPTEKIWEQYQDERIFNLEKTDQWKTIKVLWKEYEALEKSNLANSSNFEAEEYENWTKKLGDLHENLLFLEKANLINTYESAFLSDFFKQSLQEKVPALRMNELLTRMAIPQKPIEEKIFLETLDQRLRVLETLQRQGVITESEFSQALKNCLIVAKDLLAEFRLPSSFSFTVLTIGKEFPSAILPGEFFPIIQKNYNALRKEDFSHPREASSASPLEDETARTKELILQEYEEYGKSIKEIEEKWAGIEKLLVSLWK